MKYFFMIVDYIIPILMIISLSWWKKIANGGINRYSGMRTSLSMKNEENWKKANLLCGKYYFRVGIVLFILVFLIRYIKVVPMEWNSLITTSICIVSIIALTVFVNNKIKEG